MRASANIGFFSSGKIPWLFKAGNEFTYKTGGWVAQGWSGNASVWDNYSPGCTNTGSVLRSSMTNTYSSGKSGVVRTSNAIDLTNVSTIRVRMTYDFGNASTSDSGYQRLYLFTSSDTSGNWTSDYTALSLKVDHDAAANLIATNVDYTLSVAGLTGLHYICVGYVWRYQAEASTSDIVEVELIP